MGRLRRGNHRGFLLGLVSSLFVIAVGCGGGAPVLEGSEGKAERLVPADADEYGAYVHQGSDGKYVDALRVPEDEASTEGKYMMYKAVPLKAQPFGDGGEFNFWLEDAQAIVVRGGIFLTMDTDGCDADAWAVALLHFEGHRGTEEYVQHTMNASIYQEGTPLWRTKEIKGLEGHADARGPWKVLFYKAATAGADCALRSVRLEIPAFGQSHQQAVATCAQQSEDPRYRAFGGQSGDELKLSEWEDCLLEANDAALATKDLAQAQLDTAEAYRQAVSSLCGQLLQGSDSYRGSIQNLYRADCLKKKELLLARLMDSWASLPGQDSILLPLPELFPLPSSWSNEACYEAYRAGGGGSEDAQAEQAAIKAHTDCLIKDQFASCMTPDKSYEEATACYKEVVLGKKSTILKATLENYGDHNVEANEGELESEINTRVSEAVLKVEEICETLVQYAGPYDGSMPTHGQLMWFDQAYCIQDALAVLAVEIDTFVAWVNESAE